MDDLVPLENAKRRQLATARFVPQHRLDRQGYEKGDFWLGRTLSGRPFGWHEDLNLLTCAGPRSGKGVGTVIPNLMLFPGSAVVIDPKGELAEHTAKYRRDKLGQHVVILDPAKVANVPDEMRGTFNPLAQLNENDPGVVAAALSIASGIVVPNPKTKEPWWDQTALSFIQAVILYMLRFFPPEKRTLMMLRQTATLGDWDLYQAFLKHMREGSDGDPEYKGSAEKPFELLLKEMFACDAFGGLLREAASNVMKLSENSRGNVLGNVGIHLHFLSEPQLWPALENATPERPSFDLANLRSQEKFTTVYICLPVDMMYQQGRWMRLLIMQIAQYVQRTPFDKSVDRPLLMMIDEFFQLGPLPAIENMLTYAPGFGLRLWLIIQDIGQLKKNYPDTWETILGACGIKQFFSINDLQTAKYVSELLGEEEIDLPTVNASKTESQTKGESHSVANGISSSSSFSDTWSSTSGSSTSFGGSSGHNGGASSSTTSSSSSTAGGSSSDTFGSSVTVTEGTNSSTTKGTTKGYSITKKERRLLKPEEVLVSFTKENLSQLLHIRDHGGMMLIRTPYFSDPDFEGLLGGNSNR